MKGFFLVHISDLSILFKSLFVLFFISVFYILAQILNEELGILAFGATTQSHTIDSIIHIIPLRLKVLTF